MTVAAEIEALRGRDAAGNSVVTVTTDAGMDTEAIGGTATVAATHGRAVFVNVPGFSDEALSLR